MHYEKFGILHWVRMTIKLYFKVQIKAAFGISREFQEERKDGYKWKRSFISLKRM